MQPCLYSPLPPDAYAPCDVEVNTITTLKKMERGDAIWNLMWLSYPSLDKMPGAGKDWHMVHTPNPQLTGAFSTDVNIYDDLNDMLLQHPAKFAAWFAKEDHKAWAAYKVGGDAWVSTVLARAEDASVRLSSQVKIEGNVVQVRFGRR